MVFILINWASKDRALFIFPELNNGWLLTYSERKEINTIRDINLKTKSHYSVIVPSNK